MERVAFLLEPGGERLGCLLNPESVVMRRRAGVRPRSSAGGLVTGGELSDDRLLYTGGGYTELTLNLLFDVALTGSSIASEDVRDLTGPLWDLAETTRRGYDQRRPPLCRFVWGKSWNLPGIVTAVAERLEYFTATGIPRRSWLRLRLVRVMEAVTPVDSTMPYSSSSRLSPAEPLAPRGESVVHEVIGGNLEDGIEGTPGERLDQIAYRYYGNPGLWHALALFNGIDDPLHLNPGLRLQIPSLADLPGEP